MTFYGILIILQRIAFCLNIDIFQTNFLVWIIGHMFADLLIVYTINRFSLFKNQVNEMHLDAILSNLTNIFISGK